MEESVVIRVSARHVHLTKEAIDILFGDELHVRKSLNQIGQFAAQEVVRIRNVDKVIENVRVVGPCKNYNQVEISALDARKLGLNPPVRKSGDLLGASSITIETSRASITGEFAIIAQRHVHLSPPDAKKYGVDDDEKLMLFISGEKPGFIEVRAKVTNDGFFEVHLDTDDANAFLIKNGTRGVLSK